jgi:hypothetical protein
MEPTKPADTETSKLSDEDRAKLEELARKVNPSDYIAAFNRPRFAGAIGRSLSEIVKSGEEKQ